MEFVVVSHGDEIRLSIVRQLFGDYRAIFGSDVCFKGFTEEMAVLPGEYDPLVLVFDGERPIACGGIRDLGEGIAELKRIYIRPEARRKGIARKLSLYLMNQAREAGYVAIRLDTLRRLSGAVELYEQLGFKPIAPYNENADHDIVHMETLL